jgi:hypothetical protein
MLHNSPHKEFKMEKCVYCQNHRKQKPVSKEINTTRQVHSIEYIDTAYCTHKHSPLSNKDLEQCIFMSNLILECEGLFKKCTIPRNKYSDYD